MGFFLFDVIEDVFRGAGNLASDAISYTGEKVENTVKDVTGVTAAENAAKKAQEEADRQAEIKRKQLAGLRRQRGVAAAQQLAQLQQMQRDQERIISGQKETVSGLRIEQQKKLDLIKSTGSAVASSLKILSQDRKTAPTAAISPKKTRTRSPKTTQTSLQIASQGASGRGAGTNISV